MGGVSVGDGSGNQSSIGDADEPAMKGVGVGDRSVNEKPGDEPPMKGVGVISNAANLRSMPDSLLSKSAINAYSAFTTSSILFMDVASLAAGDGVGLVCGATSGSLSDMRDVGVRVGVPTLGCCALALSEFASSANSNTAAAMAVRK